MRITWLLFGVTLALCAPVEAQTRPVLPAGWERPNDADIRGTDWEYRQEMPGRYLRVEADFNGDGLPDVAELLVNRTAKTYALFVFFTGDVDLVRLPGGELKELKRSGVAVVKPGHVETLCGKGHDPHDPSCKKGPAFADLPLPGIEKFTFESASSVFYWTGKQFEQFWTGD